MRLDLPPPPHPRSLPSGDRLRRVRRCRRRPARGVSRDPIGVRPHDPLPVQPGEAPGAAARGRVQPAADSGGDRTGELPTSKSKEDALVRGRLTGLFDQQEVTTKCSLSIRGFPCFQSPFAPALSNFAQCLPAFPVHARVAWRGALAAGMGHGIGLAPGRQIVSAGPTQRRE